MKKRDNVITVKNMISKSGVRTSKALDACISFIEQAMRSKEIRVLVDRRLQQTPKLIDYSIVKTETIQPAKFFYTLADKKHLIPEQNLSQNVEAVFTHFNAGHFLLTIKRQSA